MKFHTIKNCDYSIIAPFLASSKMIDMGFSSLFSLSNSFFPEYAFYDDMLIIRMKYGDDTVYSHPLSKRIITSDDIVHIVENIIHTKKILFDYIPEDMIYLYENIYGFNSNISMNEKYSDYFSKKTDFCDLSRKGHPRKYTDYVSFIKHYNFDFKKISNSNIGDCKILFDKWCLNRDCSLCAYGCEKKLQNIIFDNWDNLPCEGIIVYVNNEPQGYLIGEQNGDTCLILYGKPIGRQNGLNVFMHIKLVELFFNDSIYVNFSPDSGMEGLAKFKNKFKPYTKINKYFCEIKKI